MEHSFQLIAERAKAAKTGNEETLDLLYNLHYEVYPESNDNDFVELSFSVYAADRAAKMGIPNSAPMPAGWIYTLSKEKSDDPTLSQRAKRLIKLLRNRLEPAKSHADIIQETALPEVEMSLCFLGKQYYWFDNPLTIRAVRLSLQERINEHALADNSSDKYIKSPRLEHAVNWLQSYEKQLVNYLEQQPNIIAPAVGAYPWAEIEALAVRIGLREAGRFTPADKLVASAVAGLIDALREAEMLPAHATLPILYAAFKDHYKRSIGVDRINDTRDKWQRTARKELGLD